MRKLAKIVLGGATLGLIAGVSQGASLYDSGGFESTAGFTTTGGFTDATFTTAGGPSLYGQSPTDPPAWSVATTAAGAAGASFAKIETSTVYSGTQAVQFTRLATDKDTYYAPQLTTAGSLAAIGQRYVDISFELNYTAGATGDPFFGIYAFNGNDSLAFGGVDATTGNVQYSQGGSGGVLPTGFNISAGSWNAFVLQLDYNPANTSAQTATLFVDGFQVGSSSFIESPETGFTDADITSIAENGSQSAVGTAYFDNYTVTTSATAVPEPATAALLLLGAGAGLLRRRRSTTI